MRIKDLLFLLFFLYFLKNPKPINRIVQSLILLLLFAQMAGWAGEGKGVEGCGQVAEAIQRGKDSLRRSLTINSHTRECSHAQIRTSHIIHTVPTDRACYSFNRKPSTCFWGLAGTRRVAKVPRAPGDSAARAGGHRHSGMAVRAGFRVGQRHLTAGRLNGGCGRRAGSRWQEQEQQQHAPCTVERSSFGPQTAASATSCCCCCCSAARARALRSRA